MEKDTASHIGASDDEIVIRDSIIWRNGAAKLIYDQVGVPEDYHLDYSVVLHQSKQDDRWGDESPAERDCYKTDNLALAIQAILPPEKKEGNFNKSYSYGVQKSVFNTEHDDCDHVDGVPLPTARPKPAKKPKYLESLSVQVEEVQAVRALMKEMSQHQEDEYSCFDQDAVSRIRRAELLNLKQMNDNSNHSLVTQLQWENDIIWGDILPSMCESSSSKKQYAVPKDKQARAGWIPSHANRYACSNNVDGFNSLFSYENEELMEGSWETEVIWDAEEFRNQFPPPKLPIFDVTDEDIVFKMPTDVRNETEHNQQQIMSTDNGKELMEGNTMKSERNLGKIDFIPLDTNNEQLRLEKYQQRASGSQRKQQIHGVSFNLESKNIFRKGPNSNFNISNDQYYLPKDIPTSILSISNSRHSRLVKEFIPPFIVTNMASDQLRNFHRPKLSAIANSPVATGSNGTHILTPLTRRIFLKQRERRELMRQGHSIPFDQPIDLSGRDGEIILIENSEEYPPLLSQVGMCSDIKTYYKSRSLKEKPFLDHPFGEVNYVSSSTSSFPFLGTLKDGQLLSAICNNLYSAPIYWHPINFSDFLLIRSKRTGYLIRDLNALFVAGQQCPVIEVPEPNSAQHRNFLKDLLQVFMYRKYRACLPPQDSANTAKWKMGAARSNTLAFATTAPKVRMDEITQHFPTLSEATIKSYLKNSSELQKYKNVAWMVMKTEFPLPSVQDLADMVTPEQVCAYYSLLAAEQRLQDAGLHSMLTLPEREKDEFERKKGRKSVKGLSEAVNGHGRSKSQQSEHSQSVLYEELLSAPWNTTSSFVAAAKGKCLLQLTGPADPTGCGEGFSYVRVAKKYYKALSDPEPTSIARQSTGRQRPRKKPSKTKGADAALRAKKRVHDGANVPAVTTLSKRRDVIQERFLEDCQTIFELQNQVLSSREILSSDDDDEDDSEEEVMGAFGQRNFERRNWSSSTTDIQQMGKNIERLLNDEVDVERIAHEEEELERLELQKTFLGGFKAKDHDLLKRKKALEREKELAQKSKENSEDMLAAIMKNPGRVLKISRTFIENGQRFERTEIIRHPVVIAAYLRIRNSKSEEFVKRFLHQADLREKKEQMLKDRMLLRQYKNQGMMDEEKIKIMQKKRKLEVQDDEYFPSKKARNEDEKRTRSELKKCGACGKPGHVRTNTDCPMYNKETIEKIVKKREEKKAQQAVKANSQNFIPTNGLPMPPIASTSMDRTNSMSGSNGDSEDDSSTSSSSEDDTDTSSS